MTHQDAARSLRDPDYVKSKIYRWQAERAERSSADFYLVHFYMAFLKETASRGIPIYATEFNRTPERQYELHRDGYSRHRAGASPHNYGLAVNIVHSLHPQGLKREEWDILGAIGQECARKLNLTIEWGGLWGHYEPARWQIAYWRELRDKERVIPYSSVPPHIQGAKRMSRTALLKATEIHEHNLKTFADSYYTTEFIP